MPQERVPKPSIFWQAYVFNAALGLLLPLLVWGLWRLDSRAVEHWGDILFWGFLVSWVQNTQIRLPIKASISQLFVILLAALLVFPLWVPPLLAFFFYFDSDILRNRAYKLYADLFNRLQNGVSIAFGAYLFYWAKNALSIRVSTFDLSEGTALLLAGLLLFAVNISLVAYIVALYTQTPFFRVWRENFSWLSLSYLVLTPVALLFARLYTANPPLLGGWGGWSVLLFLIPLYYARFHWDEYVRLKGAFEETVEALMAALEAKDAHTRFHSERVAAIATDLARAIGLDAIDAGKIRLGARIHDIGKIGIPDRILLKPGKLTDEEFEKIKEHPVIGSELLKNVNFLQEVMPIVRSHHERWDGRGYPDHLEGEAIPLWARIVSLADAYEAMTAGRPYRPAREPADALKEVLANAGTQFDPELVKVFKQLWDEDRVWRDREVFLRFYSSQASPSGSSSPSPEASDSGTSRK